MENRKIDSLLDEYGDSHQNKINKTIHWICIPTIMFSLFGMLYSIPFPIEVGLLTNWATVFMALTLVYYAMLSMPMFIGFLGVGSVLVGGNYILAGIVGDKLLMVSVIIFVVAWIGQFIGHKIEGKKPSFFKDLQFLLVGPAWLLSFIYKKVGLKY